MQVTQAWIDDLKIHDVDDPDCPYRLRSVRRTVTPRRETTSRARRHGELNETEFYGGQLLDLAGRVRGDTNADALAAMDALRGQLALGDAAHVFKVRRLGMSIDEQIEVKQDGSFEEQAQGASRLLRYAVTLVAADPRLYGATLRSGSYDPAGALSGGGVSFPLEFPLVFTTTTTTHLELLNLGNFPSPPTLTIRGPVEDPILDNDTVRKSILLVASLGETDTVVVDVAAREVRLNGALRQDLLIVAGSTWWQMIKGTNRLRLRGNGMALGKTLLTVTYRDARI